jgi:antiviral helicase SKI2
VADIECVTDTVVKGVIPDIFNAKELHQEAKEKLAKLCQSWESDEWNELDWTKLKDMQLRDILLKRVGESTIAQKAACLKCPQFVKHVSPLYFLVEAC